MAKYKVLRPIEHNCKLYLPANSARPDKITSAGHGGEIAADTSGVIELSAAESAGMKQGQIEQLPAKSDKQPDQPSGEGGKITGKK